MPKRVIGLEKVKHTLIMAIKVLVVVERVNATNLRFNGATSWHLFSRVGQSDAPILSTSSLQRTENPFFKVVIKAHKGV